MPISRERLESRKEEIKQQIEVFRQQYIAATGALADIEFWLVEVDTEHLPTETAQPSEEPRRLVDRED